MRDRVTACSGIPRFIETRLTEASPYRWVIMMVSLLGLLLYTQNNMAVFSGGRNYSIYEFILYKNQSYLLILFFYLFPLLLINSDIYSSKTRWQDILLMKAGNRFRWFLCQLAYIIFVSLFTIIIETFLECVICVALNGFGSGLNTYWNDWFIERKIIPARLMSEFSAPVLMIISQIFMTLRYCFLSILVFLVNLYCKRTPLGALAELAFSGFEWLFYVTLYYIIGNTKALYLLPIEHTMLDVAGGFGHEIATSQSERISLWFSLLYWFFLLSVIAAIIWLRIKKNDFMCQEETV